MTTKEVISTPIIGRARLILDALVENATKATVADNLNRKFVATMFEQMEISDQYREHITSNYKVLNESDVPHVEITRIVLELAELIKCKKQKFQATLMGRDLLEPGSEGVIFAILFFSFFREFNIAFSDRMMDLPELQDTIAYSLYRLSTLKDGWHDLASTSDQLLLPAVAE